MKNISIAIRSLFKKERNNLIKVLSLGIGLAMGLVLISRVYFDLSYDDFYPDTDRLYLVQENVKFGGDFSGPINQVSGGVAPGMKAELPEVEAATRIETLGENVFFTADKSKYTATFILADSCYFDVLPRPVLLGDARDVLSRPLYALISEEMAGRIGKGKSVIGETFQLDSYPGRDITIGGVFADMPENTYVRYDIIISLASFVPLHHFDCTQGWMGCDRFTAYVKLYPGIKPESLQPGIKQMLERHLNVKKLEENGVVLQLGMQKLTEVFKSSDNAKRMVMMLSLIAFVLLFTAVMNYVLIVISTLVARTKEVAVHKCYGASGKEISGMIFSETFVHLIASLAIALLLIFAFRGTVEEIVGASLSALFTVRSVVLLSGVCLVVFLLAAFLPSQLFMRIPVASAFRAYKESRRNWKRILLFTQFVAAGFLVALLVIIGLQYEKMINDNPGYTYEKVLYSNLDGVNENTGRAVVEELRRLPEVDAVATCYTIPMFGASGDVVSAPGSDEAILHIDDLYDVDAGYLPLMEMKVLQGNSFDEATSDSTHIMVSQLMADKLCELLKWTDGAVGKTIDIGGHPIPTFTIVGVYDNIRIGSMTRLGESPSAIFYSRYTPPNVLVKLHELTPANMKKVEEVMKNMLPNKDIVVNSYKAGMTNLYQSSRLFRNAVMIGGLVILIISLIGLIGYTNDEINRRRKEIAVRKINGATEKNILLLIAGDVLYMALPAVAAGVVLSYVAGEKWLQQFSDKIGLNPLIFIFSAVSVIIIIFATVLFRAWTVANDNPVNSLKSE